MNPFAFTVDDHVNPDDRLMLTSCTESEISAAMWEELAACIASEPTLNPYPASILAQRCQEGYSAVAIYNGHIISHISLAPIVEHTSGDLTWSTITQTLGVPVSNLPDSDVYEFATSWTHPHWRRKRISLALRPPLMDRWFKTNTLGISGMLGLASPILGLLGWQILAWDAIPYVNSLLAVPEKGFSAYAGYAWPASPDFPLYQGPHIPIDHPAHHLKKYHYCWVSDPSTAIALNQELSNLVEEDLTGWRKAIVSTFCKPNSAHKLVFYA